MPGHSLSSFLSLAHSLGISGFADPLQPVTPSSAADKTPTKRKLEWGAPPPLAAAAPQAAENSSSKSVKLEGLKHEALRLLSSLPSTPVKKAGSEPASLGDTVLQCSASKKRKLQTQSLTDNIENFSPNLFLLAQRPAPPAAEYRQSQQQRGGHLASCRSAAATAESLLGAMMLPPSRPPLSVIGPPPPYVTPGGSGRTSYPSSPTREATGPLHAPSTSCPVPPSPAYNNGGGAGTSAVAPSAAQASNFR